MNGCVKSEFDGDCVDCKFFEECKTHLKDLIKSFDKINKVKNE